MGVEIERKFLVDTTKLPTLPEGKTIRQGYISIQDHAIVRIRIYGDCGFLTIKGATEGIKRSEFEYPIPIADAAAMFAEFCRDQQLEKTRYCITIGQHTWELDIFTGENAGLIIAEVELADEHEAFDKPLWVTADVSDDPRYRNSNLLSHPYSQW